MKTRVNALIKHKTEMFLSNIDLINKYKDKIKSIKFSGYSQYFTKEFDRYNNIIVELEEENKEYIKEVEELKNLLDK